MAHAKRDQRHGRCRADQERSCDLSARHDTRVADGNAFATGCGGCRGALARQRRHLWQWSICLTATRRLYYHIRCCLWVGSSSEPVSDAATVTNADCYRHLLAASRPAGNYWSQPLDSILGWRHDCYHSGIEFRIASNRGHRWESGFQCSSLESFLDLMCRPSKPRVWNRLSRCSDRCWQRHQSKFFCLRRAAWQWDSIGQ